MHSYIYLYFNCNSYVFLYLKKSYIFLIIVEIWVFLAIHYDKIIFAIKFDDHLWMGSDFGTVCISAAVLKMC